jgi:hypothetical protein
MSSPPRALAPLLRRVAPSLATAAAWTALAAAPLAMAWIAPPLAGPLLAGMAWLVLRGLVRLPAGAGAAAPSLLWAGIVVSTLTIAASTLGGAAAPVRVAGHPIAWSPTWLLPAGTAGLLLVAAAGVVMARPMGLVLTSVAGIGVLATSLLWWSRPLAAALPVGACAAAGSFALWLVAPDPRWTALRTPLRVWATGGIAAVTAGAAAALARGAPPAAAASVTALLACGSAAALAAARALQRTPAREQRIGQLEAAAAAVAAWIGVATLARALGAGRADAAAAGVGLALAVHAALVATPRWRGALAEAHVAAARQMSRALAVSASALAVALSLLPADVATLPARGGVVLLGLAVIAAAERRLGAGAWATLAASALTGMAALALAWSSGIPAAWLSLPVLAGAVAAIVATQRLRGAAGPASWDAAVLGALAVGALAGLLLTLAVDPLAGVLTTAASALGPLLLRNVSPRARALAPAFGAAIPCALAVVSGAAAWCPAILVAAALVTWASALRDRTRLRSVAVLGVAALGSLAVGVATAPWTPLAVTLAGTGLLGVLELARCAREPEPRTHDAAAALAVTGPFGAAVTAAAAGLGLDLAPTLLVGASLVQAADVLVRDARVSAWMRRLALVSWLAATLGSTLQAVESLTRGAALLLGCALTASLLAILRRERGLGFVAGLLAAVAASCLAAALGGADARGPALLVLPSAAWCVAWGVLEAQRARRPDPFLVPGLVAACGALSWQAHAPTTSWPLMGVAAGAAAAVALVGALTRRRAPLLVGGAALAAEAALASAWAIGVLRARPPLAAGLALGALLLAASGAGVLVARAGGRTGFRMALSSDLVRLRERWARWA